MKEINVGFGFSGVKKIKVTDEEYNALIEEDEPDENILNVIEQKLEYELNKEYDGASFEIYEIYPT